jgi:DNA-binding MarR family transcriptional regulator
LTFLSVLQIQTLIFINQSQKVSMGDIAGYFGIELSSATSLINKLSKKKLIKRDEDQQDRRLVMIVLTNEGKKLLERAILERKKKAGEDFELFIG